MYNVSIFPKEGKRYNPIHDEFNNVHAEILKIEVGERGLFTAQSKDNGYWDTIHTSTIENVEDFGDTIIVTTRNTVYLFVKEF